MGDDDGIPVLLLTGAPGAGKTALAKEIGEQLFHAAVPHAVIDLDELARLRAFLTDVAPRLDAHIARLGIEDFTVTNGPNQNISVLAHAVLEQLNWPRPEVANLPT